MANTLTGNPWAIDTVSVSLTTNVVHVARIRWVGGSTAGHTAVVKDIAGHTIWSSVAGGANNVEDVTIGRVYSGLQVPTLASGILYITFDHSPKRF